jgi:hypothetical protein
LPRYTAQHAAFAKNLRGKSRLKMSSVRDRKFFPLVTAVVAAIVAALWLIFFFMQWRFGSSVWERTLPGFDTTEAGPLGPVHGSVPGVIVKCLAYMTVLAAAALFVTFNRSRLLESKVPDTLFSAATAIGVALIIFEGMMTRGFEGDWYNIQSMLTHPGSVPIFGQRLLLVWPAMLLKHLVPRLSYIQAFLAIQAVAIGIAVYVVGEWSALFIGRRLKFLGQILLAVFLLPTFNYYTAHDIGVVLIYTLCFLFLYQRSYWLFVVAFCAGVLNHPNILLMAPTAAVIMWTREKRSTTAWIVSLCLAAYVAIRIVLNVEVPLSRSVDLRFWWNMREFAELPRMLLLGTFLLVPWYVCGLAAFHKADPFLKAATVLLPMQLLIFSYYGQLNEARLFNGFLPVLIGIFLCYLRQYLPGAFSPSVELAGRAEIA